MAKARLLSSTEQIAASATISDRIKGVLNEYPSQDVRPLALTQWVHKIVVLGREEEHPDSEIANWIQVYAEKGIWHRTQVYDVLKANKIELRDYKRYQEGKSPVTGLYLPLKTLKNIAIGFSGMEESDIMEADYSSHKVVRASKEAMRDWVRRKDEADLREFPRWMKIVVAQFQEVLEMLEREKIAMAKFGR